MLIQKAFTKLRLRNGDDIFLVAEYEVNKKLFLKIFNLRRNEVYVGHSSDIELRSQAAKIRLTFDEFTNQFTRALIDNISDNSNFLYCLDEKDGIYKFQWKSIDEEQTIISLGSVDVRRENFDVTLTDVLELVSIEMRLMRNKIQDLSADLHESQNKTSHALEQLSLATEMKEKLEKEMYSKFILLLNEKKRKIRELQQKTNRTAHSDNADFQKKKLKKSSKTLVSDSSDDSEELKDFNEPGPSTAKTNVSFSFLDDTKSILPTNQNKIRKRKILSSKKENGNNACIVNCSQSSKNITEADDESDELLFDNL